MRHLAIVWVLLLVGCAQAPVPLATVRGKVTLNGVALKKVRVEFHPEQVTGDKFLRSTATTDDEGNFELTCDDGRPGAVVGKHKVVVAPAGRGADRAANPFEPTAGTPSGPPSANFGIYTSVATTDKVVAVVAGINEIPIELKR